MKPINAQILWDTLSPNGGKLERFTVSALAAPAIVQRGGYEPLAFLLSYNESNAKAQVWARKGKEVILINYDYTDGASDVSYPSLTSAMWSFKLEAKSLYEREDTYWLWRAVPEWSKSA